jgi:hypothetical protein
LAAAHQAVHIRPSWRPAFEAVILCQIGLGRVEDALESFRQMQQLDEPESDLLQQFRLRNPQWAKEIF